MSNASELKEAVNPIKHYEYLASGLPVITPLMRELAEINGFLQNILTGTVSVLPCRKLSWQIEMKHIATSSLSLKRL